jgi:superfamily II DNA or RNA helicase
MFKLREYQIKTVEKDVEVLSSKNVCKEILVLPTGAGKSIIIS